MRRFLTLVALLVLAAFLATGCSPKTEANAGTEGTAVTSTPSADDDHEHNVAGKTDDDGAEDHDDEGAEGDDKDEPGEKEDGDDAKPETTTSAPPKPEVKLAVYRDSEGKILCPVMGSTVESEKAAFGFQDHKNVRYYFCCDACPKLFAKDPDSWVKK